MALPLDRFLNAVYVWIVRRMDEEGRQQFDFQLTLPTPGREPTEAVVAQEMDAFAQFAASFGVTPPSTG
jgi:hypothetical protein